MTDHEVVILLKVKVQAETRDQAKELGLDAIEEMIEGTQFTIMNVTVKE